MDRFKIGSILIITTAYGHIFISFAFPQFTSFPFYVSVLSWVKMNSTNNYWSALHVWVFIGQVVEHYSVNADAMGVNPVEVPIFFRGGGGGGLLYNIAF